MSLHTDLNTLRRHRNVLEGQLREIDAIIARIDPGAPPKKVAKVKFIDEYAERQASGRWGKPSDLKRKSASK